MLYEIRDIYSYQKKANAPMLSSYNADFWSQYLNNYAYYDRIFKKKYASFFPFDQEGDLDDVAEEFSDDVKSWLMMNDKRYSELFRIQSITDDEKYSLTDNVYEHETVETLKSDSRKNVKGSETITDTTQNIYGSQTDTEDKSKTFGSQTDSEAIEKSYGRQVDERDVSNAYGATQDTETNSTSAFNESGFTNTDQTVKAGTAHTDIINDDITHGSHTDTEDNSYTHGTHTDTEDNSYTRGTHTDNLSNTRVDGQRTDTSDGEGTEETERLRTGNIGVKTVPQMLDDQKTFWVDFSFYNMIFTEISRELLRGCQ